MSTRSDKAVARQEEILDAQSKAAIGDNNRSLPASIDSFPASDPSAWIEVKAHPRGDEAPRTPAASIKRAGRSSHFILAFNFARCEAVYRLWDVVFICHKLFSERMSFCIAIAESGSYGLCIAESQRATPRMNGSITKPVGRRVDRNSGTTGIRRSRDRGHEALSRREGR
jgi:hypothetical protein